MSDIPPPPPPPPSPPPPSPQGSGAWVPSGAGSREPGRRRSVGLTILITIVTFGIWTIVWSYKNGEELKRWSGDGLGGVVYAIITVLFSPVTMFMMANEVEQLYRKEGREPAITTLWGLWFLLPLIGNLIWYVRIQHALNDYWTSHGQTNSPSL
jgi:hypothetical protein